MPRLQSLLPILLVAACGGGGNPGPGPDNGLALRIAFGDNQTGEVGTVLPAQLIVEVVDADGAVVPGRSVAWNFVGAPAGLLEAPSSVTDAAGRASNTITLGVVAGTYRVRAAAPGITGSVTFTLTATGEIGTQPELVAEVPIPPTYGIHDTFVRDGIAFVSAWNAGLRLYDVGGGGRGGAPSNPVFISSIVTSTNGVPGGAQVHNAWWFHNPTTGQKRYVFVGQEGPLVTGFQSSGDLRVVDISDIANPVEVATLRIPNAGVHNFWMDEARQVLYAAWYNGGVVAVDVSGTLTGNLANRIIAQVQPGGPANTFVWGVMVAGNRVYASDMRSGFWALDRVTLQPIGGGNNVNERYTSDLWVTGTVAYTGTWNIRATTRGNAVKVWSLDGNGAPVLADSIIISGITTVSDLAVSPDGRLLVVTAEGTNGGLYVYDRVNPLRPALRAHVPVQQGLHTGEVARINGRTYVFGARNPSNPALMVWDITHVAP